MKQVMVKISGTDILTWKPSPHSKKTSPPDFASWNIVEISCRLSKGTKVICGNETEFLMLKTLKYFSWYGVNECTDMSYMFYGCSALAIIPQLDTSNVTSMSSMFFSCLSLTTIPQLDTSSVTDISSMFENCYSLTAIPALDISMTGAFDYCYSLSAISFNPFVTDWAGDEINLSDCSLGHTAIVALFNSLPTITSTNTLTLTGNPGVPELTDEEKAIATGKNWTLTL